MSEIPAHLDRARVPRHVGVIMDGNGRWAEEQGQPRVYGHTNSIAAVRATVEGCAEIGVECLTLYAFSTENWSRPEGEVGALMQLLVETVGTEMETMLKNNIRLATIGDTAGLPARTQDAIRFGMEQTAENDGMALVLALNYSGKWDITQATQSIAREVAAGRLAAESIDESAIRSRLSTNHWPDPELIIRTSNEHRLSNFFLWQAAYAEFYFSPIFWPAFRKPDLFAAVVDFQQRERRFGKTSAQIGHAPTNPGRP